MQLDSSGGLLCVLFEATQDLFFDLLIAPLSGALGEVTGQVAESAIGLRICDEG